MQRIGQIHVPYNVFLVYCDIRGGYREWVHYGKSTPNYVPEYLHTEHSESLISVLGISVREIPIDAFDHGAMLSIHYQCKLRKWRITNVKLRVNVCEHLQECRTENIHTRNTLLIAFSCGRVMVYRIFPFYSNTATCLATNLWCYLCTSLQL